MNYKNIFSELIEVFKQAGALSLDLRLKGLKKEIKNDNTPVSNGDLEVNKILINSIKKLTPHLPIVSEENSANKDNRNLVNFWLIDPIDGTYDYINNGDEFTLNAALIENKKAAAGIVYAPAKDRLFYTCGDGKSFEINQKKIIEICCEKKTKNNEIKAVSYSKVLKPEIQNIYKLNNITEHVRMKSSLKFCVIAAGDYDFYAAEPRACEWDIAAGHAILRNAGGIITDFDGNEIFYGKKDFKNTSIILKRKKDLNNG
tara:strand:+ start:1737 stop:2510 length:774 start_codon:yes stop_codon:yes gene_type:complete